MLKLFFDLYLFFVKMCIFVFRSYEKSVIYWS